MRLSDEQLSQTAIGFGVLTAIIQAIEIINMALGAQHIAPYPIRWAVIVSAGTAAVFCYKRRVRNVDNRVAGLFGIVAYGAVALLDLGLEAMLLYPTT